MPLYYGVGDAVVSQAEFTQKLHPDKLNRLASDLREKPATAALDVAGRTIRAADILEPADTAGRKFVPIKYGGPVTVEIRWVYTGRFPRPPWPSQTRDMLIASAFKSLATFNESPRAVNLLRPGVKAQTDVEWSAVDKGTPLAFYSPGLAEDCVYATFELVFDDFPNETFEQLGRAVSSAGEVPLFIPQQAYLLAAGLALRLTGAVGHSLFDGHIEFAATERIELAHVGAPVSLAGWRILTQSPERLPAGLKIGKNGQLFRADGNPYAGDIPYVVITLDGTKHDRYSKFTPTAASAALLDKFYGLKSGASEIPEQVVEALKIYNDFSFRRKAEAAQEELKGLKPGDPDYEEKSGELQGLLANILHDELKPKSS